MYVNGKGVARDLDRAIFWTNLLTPKGNEPPPTIQLGDLYVENMNYDKALVLFQILSKRDNPKVRGAANERLSVLYANGRGVPANPKRAAKYRKLALDDGNLRALHDSAMALIASGKKAEAVSQLEQAAGRGMLASKFQLGQMLRRGDGVALNTERGLKLLHEAADQGLPEAQMELAQMALDSAPGAPDLNSAIQMTSAAIAKGHTEATPLLDKLEQRRKTGNGAPEDTAKARPS